MKDKAADTVAEHRYSLPTFGIGEWEVVWNPTTLSLCVLTITRNSTGTISTFLNCYQLPNKSVSLEKREELNGLECECYRRSTDEHEVFMVR